MQIFSWAMAQNPRESHLSREKDSRLLKKAVQRDRRRIETGGDFFSSLLSGWFEEAELPFLGTGQRNGVAFCEAGVTVLLR